MKAIVEWGSVKSVQSTQVCDISGSCVMDNPTKAASLAGQLAHTMMYGLDAPDFKVSTHNPRITMWHPDGIHWICVSTLDGVARGSYSGVARRDAASEVKRGTVAANFGFESDTQMEMHRKWLMSSAMGAYLNWAKDLMEISASSKVENSIELHHSSSRTMDITLREKGCHFIGMANPTKSDELHIFYDKDVKSGFGPVSTELVCTRSKAEAIENLLAGNKVLVGHIIYRGAKLYIFLD
ncbi:hypothetical protein [Comamonas thiooxydans]|uniref:hypothetical protein n=1 Tax=Comamonas thiooxydans TaxID=363952 RepID=UPI000B41E541|nr:hypothetical protein [Comamonas thiooxydans]